MIECTYSAVHKYEIGHSTPENSTLIIKLHSAISHHPFSISAEYLPYALPQFAVDEWKAASEGSPRSSAFWQGCSRGRLTSAGAPVAHNLLLQRDRNFDLSHYDKSEPEHFKVRFSYVCHG